VLGIWYWCADQTIVQRVLAPKTRTTRGSTVVLRRIKICRVHFRLAGPVVLHDPQMKLLKGSAWRTARKSMPDDQDLLPAGLFG